jgi:hypothetical protein
MSKLTIINSTVSFGEYSSTLNDAYKQFKIDNPPTDKEAYALACKPILNYCEELQRPDTPDDKSAVPHMRAYKKQFTNLVCFFCYWVNSVPMSFMQAGSLWNLHQILVVGAMVYVGDDPASKQATTVFGGNASIKDFIQANKVDVRKWLRNLSTLAELVTLRFTCFLLRPSVPSRSIELQKSGGVFNFPTLVDPIFKGKHGPRDRDRKIVGHFLVSRLRQ